MRDENDAIEADRKNYPSSNCWYSSSLQQKCTTANGDFVCETIKRIMRNCPQESPVEIYRNSEKETGKKDDVLSWENWGIGRFGDVEEMLRQFIPVPGLLGRSAGGADGEGNSKIFGNIEDSPFYRSTFKDPENRAGFIPHKGIPESIAPPENRGKVSGPIHKI